MAVSTFERDAGELRRVPRSMSCSGVVEIGVQADARALDPRLSGG
jgi:hypothetical protein